MKHTKESVEAMADLYDSFERYDIAHMLRDLQARIEELKNLVDKLRLEARMHAQEARTANSTIAEIYQVITGATGEPGNWNGANPVRAMQARIEELEAERVNNIPDYWLAFDESTGCVEFGMSSDDANKGEASRDQVNDFINNADTSFRLVGVYASPTPPASEVVA